MRQDIQNMITLVTTAAAALTSSDNTAMVAPSGSTGYDTLGFSAINLVIASGTLGDAAATFTTEISESDTTNGSYTAVADADLIALESTLAWTQANDNVVKQISLKPRKRFVRVTITPADNGTAAGFTVICQGIPAIMGTTA